MRVKAVLLDIDGTLVDSNAHHVAAWAQAFAEAGHDVAPARIAREIGKGTDMLVPALLPGASDTHVTALGEAHGRIFKQVYLPQVVPLPGATALARRIHDSGRIVALASSASAGELEHYCGLLDIAALVDVSTTSDDVERTKPAPDLFAVAREKAGVDADAALVIGDSPYDMEAATRCGIAALAVRSGGFDDAWLGETGARAIYDDAADLLARWDTTLLGE